MQLRKKGKRSVILNVTSLIDVMFLLLIFFMISTTFLSTPAIKLELPEAKNADVVRQNPLTIYLDPSGRLYLNDGMYGIFWELRCNGHDQYPVRCYRDGEELVGEEKSFKLFGPTCDSTDVLPADVLLPADIDVGDYLEFGCIGAYSLAGRTDFNGHQIDEIARIEHGAPPLA